MLITGTGQMQAKWRTEQTIQVQPHLQQDAYSLHGQLHQGRWLDERLHLNDVGLVERVER
jgi:hypothetical protein